MCVLADPLKAKFVSVGSVIFSDAFVVLVTVRLIAAEATAGL